MIGLKNCRVERVGTIICGIVVDHSICQHPTSVIFQVVAVSVCITVCVGVEPFAVPFTYSLLCTLLVYLQVPHDDVSRHSLSFFNILLCFRRSFSSVDEHRLH